MVYASDHSTTSSNTGSPSTPSSSGSSGSSGSTSSGSGSSSGQGSAGSPSSDTSSGVVSGGSSNNPTPSSQGGSTAHCDRPGYPSCSSLGSEAGNKAAGTSCPPGHSKAFCSAYNVAAGSSTLLLPSQALPLKKGILQQARSVIIPHHPTRQMLYTAINQPIHLAIV